MSGLVYYEGMKVEIEIEGHIDDNIVKNLEDVTWLVSSRIGLCPESLYFSIKIKYHSSRKVCCGGIEARFP